MASDLSSGCGDDIDIFEEKEEGELSLEDVSSSEESHPNYRSGFPSARQCKYCMAPQCAQWCIAARASRKSRRKLDAAHGKENRRHMKDSSGSMPKHIVATLQEKNDDLVPISSDSDMDIVGLPGNSKQSHARSKSMKIRKKKKKKRSHGSVVRIDDSLSPTQVETYLVDVPIVKRVRLSRAHYRESSPPRHSVRSPLEKPLVRSPSRRYRASRPLKSRSPLRRSRSPVDRAAPAGRKSPRKLRSPRRSLSPRSPLRSGLYRETREHASPSLQTYLDVYDVKLLKKVRRLVSVDGDPIKDLSRSKEHSSLKEKLSNMMKNQAEGSHEKLNSRKRSTTSIANNNNNKNGATATVESDDEDNIEVLRRLALETKPKKSENKIEEPKTKSEVANAEESDDNDIEANELRILALRSAIMKKHEKRVTRGVKSKRPAKSETRVESPFSEIFLDDIYISEEEDSSVKSPATRSSPIFDDESNHPEDMDLDTDVEREKEKDLMPYSPTDELTREIVVEPELTVFNDNNNEVEKLPLTHRQENAIVEFKTLPEDFNYRAGVDTPYSPCTTTETTNKDEEIASINTESSSSPERESLLHYQPGVDTAYSPDPTAETPKPDELLQRVNDIANTERPYSPTDTPTLDPELFPIFPNLPAMPSETEDTRINRDKESSASKTEEPDLAVVRNTASTTLDEMIIEFAKEVKDSEVSLQPQEDEKTVGTLTIAGVSALTLREDSFKPIDTPDKLPEVDLDGSPLVPVSKELEGADLIIPIENLPDIVDSANEPLYLQCLTDIAKDTSKIPTLVNRTLVPALILKTNKQLQQPLPQKKVDNHAEPSFKSAEMRPVSVETAPVKSATLFKPIKLCPIAKKPQVMTTMVAAAFGDDSLKETEGDDDTACVETSPTVNVSNKSPTSGNSQKLDEETEEKKKSSAKSKKQRRRSRDKMKASGAVEALNCAKEGKKVIGASKLDEREMRTTIKQSLIKSWENFQEIVLKDPADKSTEREATAANNDKATASNKVTGTVGEKKKKTRRSKKKSKRLSGSFSHANKSSDLDATKNIEQSDDKSTDLDATKNIEQSDDKSTDKEQMETNKNEGDSTVAREESDETEKNRRSSIDEDEEALRALLLASLPKRTKQVDTSLATPPKNAVDKISQPSQITTDPCVENSASKLTKESTVCSTELAFTPVNPSVPSSQSSNTISATQAKVEAVVTTTKNIEVAEKILASESNSSVVELSPLTLRKRANTTVIKGPPKKIVKKALPVLASTKVVNNAKKYQNALLQKKLNVQRAAMNYGAQNGSRNITLNNLKNNDAARPSSPKISAASKTQRLVINLGSDSDSETELEDESTSSSNNGYPQPEVRKPLSIPTTDFEKSVVQFLRDQRKKLESVNVSKVPTNLTATTATVTTTATMTTTTTTATTSATNKTVTNTASPATGKLAGIYNTPLAVRRHLPVSQQEEYRRLKQEIMERERLKLQKTMDNGSGLQNPSLKSPCTPPGPLSPASPIAATQKSQINHKSSSVTTQVAPSTLASSSRDKIAEKPVMQKKIQLARANENRPASNIANVSKTIVPAIPSKQLTKPLTASSKVNSNIPNVPSKASTAKVPIKALPKGSSIDTSASIPAITSTPKAQTSISTKTYGGICTKAPLSLAKDAASITEIRGKFAAEAPCAATKIAVESSTSVPMRNEAPWNLGTTSVSSLPPMATNYGNKSSLNPTEMLTIQIPNDKIQTERVASVGISKGESSSPPNGRNVGMLKILTKEQLNSRFVKIQVKQGPAGRTVTIGGSPFSQNDAARSASSSPIPKVLPEGSSDKFDKTLCCDSSLIVNESTVTKRGEKRPGESLIGGSEDSTLVLSRKEENSIGSKASTVVLSQDNSHNDTTVDSSASTFVLVHDNSECRESPGIAGTEKHEDETLATNSRNTRSAKSQIKEGDKIRSDVKNELEILTALPIEKQRILLTESQENLVAKRNMVVDDLTEMSGCLRQLEVEREIQTKLIAEVRRLREQLKTAEKRLHEQRAEMNSMVPKVTKAHEKINHGRQECYKLSRICHGLGVNVIGDDYKVPDTGAQLLNERLKEVAVHTRQLSKKKVPPIGSLSDSGDTNSSAPSTGSDTLSDSSFAERPLTPTTPLPETTFVGETTNSSMSETDLDDSGVTRENSEASMVSIVDSPCENSISERVDVFVEEKAKSSDANEPSKEIIVMDSAREVAQTKNKEGSSSSETNAQATKKQESNPSVINGQTKEKEAPSTSKCNANDNSDIPATNLISEDRDEYVSMPSTSKYYPHRQLTSDEQPNVKSKIDPYKSVLTHLKASRSVNPGGILCPYELMGTCSDVDCQFYHLNPGHCQ